MEPEQATIPLEADPGPVPGEPEPEASERRQTQELARREEFAAVESRALPETASTAVAAQARAAVEARYVMALKRPRDWDQVRQNLMKECRRPSFAQVARYRKPIGKGIEGLSIRFAEAAIRCMTNVLPEVATIYDDDRKRIVRASLTDLEANVTYSKDIVVEKVVERSKPRDDGSYISVRKNSYGKLTYTVEANEDDLLNKEGALVSKALRTLALRILPGDLREEAELEIRKTLQDEARKDPDAERKRLADAFASVGVQPSDLKAFLGHTLEQTAPAELVELRAIYVSLKDGETNWREVMEAKGTGGNGEESDQPGSKTDRLKAKLAEKAASKK